ncbi:MAG: hypothetical protein EXQ96_02255 [Alphaproteobacteria bacterium]|nr:hypothetical protein [Alphaproteobacteria bacterium]
MQALLAVVAVLVVYGALYPLNRVGLPDLGGLTQVLSAPWTGIGLGVGFKHMMLMVPIGLIGTHAVFTDRRLVDRAFGAIALAIALSLLILLLRPNRAGASLGWLGYAAFGAALGALVAAVPGLARRDRDGLKLALPASVILVLALLAAHLAPYLPVTSPGAFVALMKPLLDYPSAEPLAILATFLARVDVATALGLGLGWLLVLAAFAAPRREGATLRFALLMVPTLALKAVVHRNGLSPTDLAGALGALLLWYGAFRWLPDGARAGGPRPVRS